MPRKYNITPDIKFGFLTVIKEVGRNKNLNVLWLCRCVCNKEKILTAYRLVRSSSCGCKRPPMIGSISPGQRFGMLITLRVVGQSKQKRQIWLCRCTCGKETTSVSDSLLKGSKLSCGCKRYQSVQPGTKFGGLTVVKEIGFLNNSIHRSWLCKCICGEPAIIETGALSKRSSCGCLQWSTKREKLIKGLFEGKQNKQIAEDLDVTRRTIKEWIDRLAKELGINSKIFLVKIRIVYLLSQTSASFNGQDTSFLN